MLYFKIGECLKEGILMNDKITITCNGVEKTYPKNVTYYDISRDFQNENDIVSVIANNDLKDLSDKVISSQKIEFLDCLSNMGNKVYENGLNIQQIKDYTFLYLE